MLRFVLVAFCILSAASCWGEEVTVNMEAVELRFGKLQTAIQEEDWSAARELAEDYLEADDFNAHIGGSMAGLLLPHEQLLAAAEHIVGRCLSSNTLENLAMLGATNSSEMKRQMDFAWFYSMQALIYLKTERIAQADSSMAEALSHMTGTTKPQAVDYLRAGIIAYARGRQKEAWDQIQRGLLLDSTVEHTDPVYLPRIAALVEEREGHQVQVEEYIAQLRRQHAEVVPDLSLTTHDGRGFSLHGMKGKVLFVNFFSPICSTCQQEVPAIKALYEAHVNEPAMEFIFVLNNPLLRDRTTRFMERAGLSAAQIVVLAEGSAFDYIPGEPTVWIVDADGRLVGRHTGYRDGDEQLYAQELTNAMR